MSSLFDKFFNRLLVRAIVNEKIRNKVRKPGDSSKMMLTLRRS